MKQIAAITLLVCIVPLTNCSPTKQVDCPPKFTIYKNINKAYPVYARDFELELKNSIDIVGELQDTLNLEIKNKAVKLRQDLDNYSSMVENLVKSNLMAYFGGICDAKVRDNFGKFQERLADITVKLSEIRALATPVRGSNLSEKLDEATKEVSQMTSNVK